MKLKISIDGIDIILFIILLICKLDGIIDMKWVWVFCPIWSAWIISIVGFIITAIATREPKAKHNFAFGKPLIWDAKTNTLYGDFNEVSKNET